GRECDISFLGQFHRHGFDLIVEAPPFVNEQHCCSRLFGRKRQRAAHLLPAFGGDGNRFCPFRRQGGEAGIRENRGKRHTGDAGNQSASGEHRSTSPRLSKIFCEPSLSAPPDL